MSKPFKYVVSFWDDNEDHAELFVHSNRASAEAHVRARIIFRLTGDILRPGEVNQPGVKLLMLCIEGGSKKLQEALELWNELYSDEIITISEESYYTAEDRVSFEASATEDYFTWLYGHEGPLKVPVHRELWHRKPPKYPLSCDGKHTLLGFIAEALYRGYDPPVEGRRAKLSVLLQHRATPRGPTLEQLATQVNYDRSINEERLHRLLAPFHIDLVFQGDPTCTES